MSTGAAATIRVIVDANTGAAERKLSKFEQRLSRAQSGAGKFAHGVDLAGLAVAGLATYGLAKAIEAGTKFERQLSTLGAVSHASAGQMKRLENQSLKLGESTIFTARQVAEAQTELAKGGLTAKQILGGGTKSALALAAAGQMELAEAAETTVNAMKLFGIQAKDSESIADGFATAANRTTGDVSDFAEAMKQGGAVAKLAGFSFNNTLAVLESLAEAGVKGSDAGTSLKTSLSQLIKPSTKQASLMKELGFHTETANGELKKGAGLSKELIRVTDGMTKAERAHVFAVLGGTDGIRTLNALYDEGPAKIRKLEQANKKQGTAQEVAAKQTQNFQGELEQLQGAAETLGIRIFKVMKPALMEAVKWAGELTQQISAIFADENLTGPEKFKKSFDLVFEKLVPLFEGAMTQMSEVAAENAPKAALAFVKGWLNAGPWGKLFSAAYLYGKFGGAFGGMGRRAGTAMGEEMAASGGLSGALSKGMRLAGAAAAGYFVAEFGTQVVEKISGSNILEGQSLAASLTHGFNTSGVAKTEQDTLQKAEGLNFTKSKAQLESLQAHFAATLHKIETDAAVGVGGIDKALSTGLHQADETWLHGSRQWREHTVEAMRGAVGAIKEGMDAGFIKTKEGQKAIDGLLAKIHLTTGKDPFGVAKGLADEFKRSGTITQQGVREWVGKLDQMPKGAREKAREAMSEMLKAWAQGHPKIENQVESLTKFETQKFGSANAKLRSDTDKALKHMSRSMLNQLPVFHNFVETGGAAFENLSGVAAGALKNIGENVESTLKTLHGPAATFTVKYLKEHGDASGKKYLNKVPAVKKQRGGPINLGAPSGDTVPAMLERGEYVLNRKAVAAVGKPQLDAVNFGSAPRFQTGGLAEPQISGPSGAMRDIGQSAVSTVFDAAKKAIASAQAKSGGALFNGPTPPGVGIYDGKPVDKWIIPILAWARQHGWGGSVTSGYRNDAEQMAAAESYGLDHYGPGGPLASNHTKTSYPGGAVDVTLAAQLAAVLKKYTGKPNLVWGGPVMGDEVHFSATGHQRGGLIGELMQGLQSGGAVVKTAGPILLRNGLDLVSAGGILGNSYGESGWNTEAMEPGTHNGGLFGFTAGEKSLSALEAYAAKRGKPWGDTETQIQFMLHTLPTSMRSAMNNMSKVSDTTSYFMHEWERPENYSSLGTRIEHGQEAVKILEGAGIKGAGKGASDEHTYKEDVPAEYGGVAAGKTINFPSGTPKSLELIAKELKQRQGEVGAYGRAIKKAEAKKRPGIVQALQQNLTKLQTRIAELERARKKLRIEKAKKQFTGKLTRKLANLTGFEVPIKEAERAFNMAQETATHTTELEPLEEKDPGAYLRWINNNEKPAYAVLFERAADWRNTVLSAERAAAGHWEAKGPLGGLEGGWENKIIGIGQEVAADEKLINQTQADQRAFKKQQEKFAQEHPNAKHPLEMPDWLKKEIGEAEKAKEQIPMLGFKERELRSFLGKGREEFYPGGARVLEPKPPIAGSGNFEEQLENLQGIKWPRLHGKLDTLPGKPSIGGFGGLIWDIQSQASELELKMGDTLGAAFESVASSFGEESLGGEGGGGEADTATAEREKARNEWLEEELRKASQRNAVFTRQGPIIDAYASKNFAGLFAQGGSIPAGMWGIAGEAGPEPVFGPATVVSNRDANAAVGAAANSATNGVGRVVIEDHRVRVFDRDDKEIETVVTKMNRQSGRRAKTIGARGAGRVS